LKIKTKNQSKKTNQALTTKDMKVQLFTFVWLLVAWHFIRTQMEEGDPSLALLLMTTFYISQIIRYLKKLFESMFYKVLVHEQEIPP
jgi:hypothetical protein